MSSEGAVVQLDDAQKAIPKLTTFRLLDMPCNHILFFVADNTAFQVEKELQRKPPGWSCKILFSSNERSRASATLGPLQTKHYDQTTYDKCYRESIAISRRQLLGFEAVMTVIKIDRQHNMAYRVNIGEVSQKDKINIGDLFSALLSNGLRWHV